MHRSTAPRRLAVRAARIGLAWIVPLTALGCAAIPLATLGTVADIAGSAAASGPAVYKMGKLDIAYLADFNTVQRAARLAAYDLRLTVLDDPLASKNPRLWKLKLQDNLNSKIAITVEPRTPTLCLCRVDVGLFGSEPTAKLIMTHISAHLSPPPPPPATR